jgi:hypothetical protein
LEDLSPGEMQSAIEIYAGSDSGDTKLEEIIPCRTGFARRILNKLTPTDIKRGM